MNPMGTKSSCVLLRVPPGWISLRDGGCARFCPKPENIGRNGRQGLSAFFFHGDRCRAQRRENRPGTYRERSGRRSYSANYKGDRSCWYTGYAPARLRTVLSARSFLPPATRFWNICWTGASSSGMTLRISTPFAREIFFA